MENASSYEQKQSEASDIESETNISPEKATFKRTPSHVAIIPDGNRRWADIHLHTTAKGHEKGASRLIEIARAAIEHGISTLTFYGFSTENWSRPLQEVDLVMHLIESSVIKEMSAMRQEGIALHTIGNIPTLPRSLQRAVETAQELTKAGTKLNLVLALNYGGRDELCRAVQQIAEKVRSGALQPSAVTEAIISSHLDTTPWGDPDLLIRTSGEQRISNFLLWQLSYTELYVTNTLWPDFTSECFREAILEYQRRNRRIGS